MAIGRADDQLPRRIGIEPIGPPLPNLTPPPRSLVLGLVARTKTAAQDPAMAALINAVVLEIHWRDLQPTGLAALDSTELSTLVSDLDWAQTQGYKVRLRVFSGAEAPANVVTAAGGMSWYNNDNPSKQWLQLADPVPRWWQASYHTAYQDFMTRLASASIVSTTGATVFANHPALAEICMSLGATDSAEPFIHQFAYAGNRSTALANGWTKELDVATLEAGSSIHASVWNPYSVATYFPFNPWQGINPTTGGSTAADATTSIALMEDFVSKCLRMAVVANNSLMAPKSVRGTKYETMYNRHITLRAQTVPYPVPIGFQTATLTKHKSEYNDPTSDGYQTQPIPTTPFNTVTMAQQWGATSVELPNGCEDDPDANFLITPAQAATFNAQFIAQSAPLLA